MTDVMIPPEVVEAAAIKLAEGRLPEYSWADLDDEMRTMYREDATAALRAGLAAWPGMQERTSGYHPNGIGGPGEVIERRIVLPLTTQSTTENDNG